jgi:hypothetical protein
MNYLGGKSMTKTAQQISDELIYRMKTTSLNKFEIKREVGENWLPNGVVPFDLSAKNGIATFTVWAESIQDAEDQVSQFLEQDDNE